MKFNLLYKVSRDGDRISTFTEKVSKKCPTLILIKTTDNYKFGGYTSQQWNMTGSYTYVKDELAFIFSLNKKKNILLKIIMLVVQFVVILIILLLEEDMIFVFGINIQKIIIHKVIMEIVIHIILLNIMN